MKLYLPGSHWHICLHQQELEVFEKFLAILPSVGRIMDCWIWYRRKNTCSTLFLWKVLIEAASHPLCTFQPFDKLLLGYLLVPSDEYYDNFLHIFIFALLWIVYLPPSLIHQLLLKLTVLNLTFSAVL